MSIYGNRSLTNAQWNAIPQEDKMRKPDGSRWIHVVLDSELRKPLRVEIDRTGSDYIGGDALRRSGTD